VKSRAGPVPGDWCGEVIPANVVFGESAYVDSAYGFAPFRSLREPGLVLGDYSGIYNRSTLAVGPEGQVIIGSYTVLNETYVICHDRVTIGSHCLISWGVFITDVWDASRMDPAVRRRATTAAAGDPFRRLPALARPKPVEIEDAVWIGFNAVILPGTRLGRGSIVGCHAVVSGDVPPFSFVAGNPARVVRQVQPVEIDEVRARLIADESLGPLGGVGEPSPG